MQVSLYLLRGLIGIFKGAACQSVPSEGLGQRGPPNHRGYVEAHGRCAEHHCLSQWCCHPSRSDVRVSTNTYTFTGRGIKYTAHTNYFCQVKHLQIFSFIY